VLGRARRQRNDADALCGASPNATAAPAATPRRRHRRHLARIAPAAHDEYEKLSTMGQNSFSKKGLWLGQKRSSSTLPTARQLLPTNDPISIEIQQTGLRDTAEPWKMAA
jgi:hypothetical protein